MSADLAYDEHLSIYNYYQCYQWSLEHNFAPAGDGSAGQWSPNEYGWFAFPLKSGDPYISFFNMEFHLDTRRKEYSKVPGSSNMYEFWAAKAEGGGSVVFGTAHDGVGDDYPDGEFPGSQPVAPVLEKLRQNAVGSSPSLAEPHH